MLPYGIQKIISGGQTGADRAALDWAMEHGIPHGGWCPKGRRAEDGHIPEKYRLQETPSADYSERTEKNVMDSDATVIFTEVPVLSGGSLLTAQMADRHQKPWIRVNRTVDAVQRLVDFLLIHQPQVLNVAGPRLSQDLDIGKWVKEALDACLA